jgi:hypothetical protein
LHLETGVEDKALGISKKKGLKRRREAYRPISGRGFPNNKTFYFYFN